MFDNIGSKIKSLAQVVCWIGIIASVIGGIIVMASHSDAAATGLLIIAIGVVGSWVGSFALYGFGQLIENSDTLVEIAKHNALKRPSDDQCNEKKPLSDSDADEETADDSEDGARCPHCDRRIIVPEGTLTANCPWCGKRISFMR